MTRWYSIGYKRSLRFFSKSTPTEHLPHLDLRAPISKPAADIATPQFCRILPQLHSKIIVIPDALKVKLAKLQGSKQIIYTPIAKILCAKSILLATVAKCSIESFLQPSLPELLAAVGSEPTLISAAEQ